ncbi:MAG: PhnA domain protein [Epsilonproteobacteria bacterium]|nr:MAG: PhnA domain protein [Campylobacterota bacterium]
MSNKCELCGSENELSDFVVDGDSNNVTIVLCSNCKNQIESGELDENHFNCLNDSMWSESSAVKVLTFRLLSKLSRQDLVDMMYLEEDERKWAEAGLEDEDALVYKDANGVTLQAGDTVVITKDLDVKGTGFTAKRGTAVRNIGLVHNDAEHIEGRVNGVKIHILTKFLKKS